MIYLALKFIFQLKCHETNVIVTEPHFDFAAMQETMNEIFFEEYEFRSILRTNASTLSCYQVNILSTSSMFLCGSTLQCDESSGRMVKYLKAFKIDSAVYRLCTNPVYV